MEYSEAINDSAAERALAIALEMHGAGAMDLHEIAVRAVASAYCVCVTDGEDAAEHGLSEIHAGLIDDVEQHLAAHAAEEEQR
jgi:hypothetical protein